MDCLPPYKCQVTRAFSPQMPCSSYLGAYLSIFDVVSIHSSLHSGKGAHGYGPNPWHAPLH